MEIKTGFDMGEKVGLKYGNYKDVISRVCGMEISENMSIKYKVEVTIPNIIAPYSTLITSDEDKVRHVDKRAVLISQCSRCGETKPIGYDDICIDCISDVIMCLEGYIIKGEKDKNDDLTVKSKN